MLVVHGQREHLCTTSRETPRRLLYRECNIVSLREWYVQLRFRETPRHTRTPKASRRSNPTARLAASSRTCLFLSSTSHPDPDDLQFSLSNLQLVHFPISGLASSPIRVIFISRRRSYALSRALRLTPKTLSPRKRKQNSRETTCSSTRVLERALADDRARNYPRELVRIPGTRR